jgi:hypothetical protein
MPKRSISTSLRNSRRMQKQAEASVRAEEKALLAGTPDWAPFPGSGVHLATLRRLEAAKKLVYQAKTDEKGRITAKFRTVLTIVG